MYARNEQRRKRKSKVFWAKGMLPSNSDGMERVCREKSWIFIVSVTNILNFIQYALADVFVNYK